MIVRGSVGVGLGWSRRVIRRGDIGIIRMTGRMSGSILFSRFVRGRRGIFRIYEYVVVGNGKVFDGGGSNERSRDDLSLEF